MYVNTFVSLCALKHQHLANDEPLILLLALGCVKYFVVHKIIKSIVISFLHKLLIIKQQPA